VVNRQGRISSDSPQTVLKAATALACDALGRLYVVSPDFVAVVEPRSAGDYQVLSIGYVKISAYAVVGADDGRIFVAGRLAGNGFPLHCVTTHGVILRSFGEGAPNSAPDPMLMDGFLLWDAARKRVLMVPRNLPELQVYDRNGDDVDVKGLGAPQWDDDWFVRVWGVAWHPDGRIVIQGRMLSWPPGPTGVFLNVLDRNLNRATKGLHSPYGILVGSDRNGLLYFVSDKHVRCVRLAIPDDSQIPDAPHAPVL